ncbi:TIGR01906 family membrane protein [Haloimpatiens massiliensis]|uniref:TIGR01906 family membrane protein n=1 Tax=Haloimpatiens massiliensis TaxID=1658110 RepID=UPI000C840124|nr:TIGR01906 family membrane protein [Haloimpatiens massiliensis]
MKNIYKIITSTLICFIIILWSILFTVNFKPIYYFSIDKFQIQNTSSLEKNEIKNNYNYLIDYLMYPNNNELDLPSFSSSKEGIMHFIDVKTIFQNITTNFYIFYLGFLWMYFLLLNKNLINTKETLKLSSTFLLSLMGAIVLVYMNFQKGFDIFHKLIFKNDYWMFSPEKDPIINILPESFFALCLFFILLLISINSIIMLIFSKKLN